MKLFSFWRLLATYRVRIALNLKGLVPDEVVDVNLLKGAQREGGVPRSQSHDGASRLDRRQKTICSSCWRSSNILTRRIRTHRCCRATLGGARVLGASHKSSPAIHTR